MGDAAAYRHWTDAELELLADRSLAAAEVAAATGRTEMAPEAVDELSGPIAQRQGAPAEGIAGRAVRVLDKGGFEELDGLALLLEGPEGIGALALVGVELGIVRRGLDIAIVHICVSLHCAWPGR